MDCDEIVGAVLSFPKVEVESIDSGATATATFYRINGPSGQKAKLETS